jgi:hypothetical protein
MLRSVISFEQDDWHEYLPALEFAYNNRVNPSTGFTPFYLATKQHPRTPATPPIIDTSIPAVDDFVSHYDAIQKAANDHIALAQDRQARYANEHRRDLTYRVNDRVLLSTRHTIPVTAKDTARLLAVTSTIRRQSAVKN